MDRESDFADISRLETLPSHFKVTLHRPPRGGKIPKAQLQRRIDSFSRGRSTSRGAQAFSRKRRVIHDDLESRAARAEALVQMGELSSARQALEGAALAPGNDITLRAFQDPSRRPPVLRDPIPDDLLNVVPSPLFTLDSKEIARNVRNAKRVGHFRV